jgi:ABC-type antimicrobial peptide transport system permease subunit
MRDVVDGSPGVPARRVLTAAFMGFALLAVVLGAIGLFGVVAHDVASRRVELALRVALGAAPVRLLLATLGHGASMVGSALIAGGLLSLWTSRALSGVVAGAGRFDVARVSAAGGARDGRCGRCQPVARRAARTDLIALRSD